MIADYEGEIAKLFEGGENGEYPILVTRNLVLFPAVVTPILIGRQQSLNLVKRLEKKPETLFCVFSQKKQEVEIPSFRDIHTIKSFGLAGRRQQCDGHRPGPRALHVEGSHGYKALCERYY